MPDLPNVPPFPNDDEVPTGPASGTDADLVDPEEAELIAYLDGELDEEESRSIAARMALNPEIRERAEAYKKTFDLLDYLPKPELPADFTTRTLTDCNRCLRGNPVHTRC
jgi:anti-sigma factor RsiW